MDESLWILIAFFVGIFIILATFKVYEFYMVRQLKAEKHQRRLQAATAQHGQILAPVPQKLSIFSNEVAAESVGSLSEYFPESEAEGTVTPLTISPGGVPMA